MFGFRGLGGFLGSHRWCLEGTSDTNLGSDVSRAPHIIPAVSRSPSTLSTKCLNPQYLNPYQPSIPIPPKLSSSSLEASPVTSKIFAGPYTKRPANEESASISTPKQAG